MLYAIDHESGSRREPTGTGDRALCPTCRKSVRGKCGQLILWHWAHEDLSECDSWSEGETPWHRDWKACVPPSMQEVVIGPHRADIRLKNGMVVELQHSPISPETIFEREQFYGNMIWLFDGRDISISPPNDQRDCECQWESNDFGTKKTWTCDRCRDSLQLEYSKFGVWIKTWKRRRKSWLECECPLYIDLGEHGILHVTKIVDGKPKYGKLGSCEDFQRWLGVQSGLLKPDGVLVGAT